MDYNKIPAYELVKTNRIEELETDGYILRHKKTGARVVLMDNKDDNKVFYIGFRTPPRESTGVMHILEHSVLCGSDNFPVKDPFIELAKGSLNTFLNAMTYPDKTVYPVASCNDKDFQNLMHIYLDAVFFPNILKSDKTFRQEGWHYELESADSELKINGVVYSEMKGAFSSPDDVFERTVFNSLFPDTPYSEESGGDPKVIPELTYEHYIDVYKKYYHPSNSYIYLYGDMDFEEKLNFIDKEYLGKFEAITVDSALPVQKPFESAIEVKREYSITESEPLTENSYLSLNTAMQSNLDREEYIAWQVIDYALCSSQGAVLKEALLKAGIGKDIYSQYDNGVKQPYFSIVSKFTDEDKKGEFLDIINEVLSNIVKNGFDRNTLLAGLNGLEFRYREADFGSYPPGLMYGLQALDSWLYDDELPFIHIEADATFKSLRAKIDTGYYENLVKKGLVDNTHKSIVIVTPAVGLVNRDDEELKLKLAEYKASLSEAELDKLVSDTAELIAYQEEEDTPEALSCIPVLKISDIKKETSKLYNEVGDIAGKVSLYHPIHTNGIDYARIMFIINDVPARLFPYVSLLKNVMGLIDTTNYTYQELYNKIYMEIGGLAPAINQFEKLNDSKSRTITFDWKGKCLEGDLDKVFDILQEIIFETNYDSADRIHEIVDEIISRTQETLIGAGHQVALQRATSYFSERAAVSEILSGLDAYKMTDDIAKNYDDKKDELIANLRELASYIITKDNVMFDFTGSEKEYEVFKAKATWLLSLLPEKKCNEDAYSVDVTVKNEGFTSASQVQYVCRAGNYMSKGLPYTGSLRALKVIMGYDYLWNNIRVKGGAYGCMNGFGINGDSYFVSYRDPNLTKTIDVYEGVPDYLKSFNADERAMTQYIIGAISDLDTPLNPANKAIKSLAAYMTGLDEAFMQKERDELLATTCDSIRGLAKYAEAVLDNDCLCVIGNDEKIKGNSDIFGSVKSLL